MDENYTNGANIYENFGANLARLRVLASLTQVALAQILGVTHQAVSQWECGDTMPDIMTLPKLASALGVTMDGLFGIGSGDGSNTSPAPLLDDYPQDGGKLRALIFIGKKMVKSREIAQNKLNEQRVIFEYRGSALNVESYMTLQCGDVSGNATAGHSMTCENVKGNATAGHSMQCGDVGQNATAGHSLNCRGNVGGGVRAGHGLTCGNVNGDVNAGHSVNVSGNVSGSVNSRR